MTLETGDAPVGAVAFGGTDRTIVAGTARGLVLAWDLDRIFAGSAAKLESLASRDPGEAYRAMAALAALGSEAVAMLKKRLADPSEKLETLIGRLDDAEESMRDKAARELEWVASEDELREAAAGEVSAERRLRLDEIRKSIRLPRVRWPPGLFTVRAIAVLERIATPEAKELLESMKKQSVPRAAREAAQALGRLKGGR